MDKFLPIIIIGAILGVFSLIFIVAYLRLRRDMADGHLCPRYDRGGP